jgi:hypothetical protein
MLYVDVVQILQYSMSLVDKLEDIINFEVQYAEKKAYQTGYMRGVYLTIIATTMVNFFLLSPFLSQKLLPLEASNFTQCLAVRPEQACSAYCNSPTFLR